MPTLVLNETDKARLVAKGKEMLKVYNGGWADHWESVMNSNTNSGWDINLWSEGQGDPIFVSAYAVINNDLDTSYYLNITNEVLA